MFANVDQMITAAQKLVDAADDIGNRYKQTKGNVDQLLSEHWSGIAPEARSELWTDWDQGFTLVQAALNGMALKINQAALEYVATDQENKRNIERVEPEIGSSLLRGIV